MTIYSHTDTDPLQRQIKRSSAESADWQIPLQSTYAVRHFAKSTDTVSEGSIQATVRLASAACI